jgi:hypothetical protein
VLNSSNVKIYNNTFVNSTACISRDSRSAQGDHFGWHPSTGPDVGERIGHVFVNNLLYGDENFDRLLLYTMQPDELCKTVTQPQFKELDYNVYVRAPGMSDKPLLSWSPLQDKNCWKYFDSLDGIRKLHPEFSANSIYYPDYNGPLFMSRELGNFKLLENFPAYGSGALLPAQIQDLIGNVFKPYIGAYPE